MVTEPKRKSAIVEKMPLKKVAIVGTRGYPSYYGGFETAIRHLVPYLADNGWNVDVYGRKGQTAPLAVPNPRINAFISKGIDTKSLSTLSYGFSACLKVLFSRPDVVLVMNVANGYFLPLYKLAGLTTLVNVDGVEWHRAKWGPLAKTVFRVGGLLTAVFATELIFDSVAIGKYWTKYFNRRGHYIPYGGDATVSSAELPFGLKKSDKYILAVARLVPENSIELFFDAVQSLLPRNKVVLVGAGNPGEMLEEKANQLSNKYPNFIRLGHISDDKILHQLWANCGAYFHGHTVGGTNPALVQAMTCGSAIVAVNTNFNAEVLKNTGLLVAPGKLEVLEGIEAILNDERLSQRLSNLAMERAKTNFTWQQVNQRYLRLLNSVTEAEI